MTNDDLKKKIDKLDFAIEKSMRYHQRRRGHYDFYHNLLMFGAIAGGSAAFANMSEYFAAAAAVFAAANLVWKLSYHARTHEILFRRFSELAISIRTTESPTNELYGQWIKNRIEIETEEPPIYWALEADCDNEVRRAWGGGRDKKLVNVDWWCRMTMNWHHHAKRSFELVPQKQINGV